MAAGPSVAVSEARPESFLAAEKDLRDWLPFQDFFLFCCCTGKDGAVRDWKDGRTRTAERAGF